MAWIWCDLLWCGLWWGKREREHVCRATPPCPLCAMFPRHRRSDRGRRCDKAALRESKCVKGDTLATRPLLHAPPAHAVNSLRCAHACQLGHVDVCCVGGWPILTHPSLDVQACCSRCHLVRTWPRHRLPSCKCPGCWQASRSVPLVVVVYRPCVRHSLSHSARRQCIAHPLPCLTNSHMDPCAHVVWVVWWSICVLSHMQVPQLPDFRPFRDSKGWTDGNGFSLSRGSWGGHAGDGWVFLFLTSTPLHTLGGTPCDVVHHSVCRQSCSFFSFRPVLEHFD